jgi:hypothetical protein
MVHYSNCRPRGGCSRWAQHAFDFNERDNFLQSREGLQIGHHEGFQSLGRGAHADRIGFHHVQVCAYVRREISLVDYEQIALGDAGATLTGNFLTCGHIDHIDREVAQFRAEGCGQVVASAFHEHDVGIGVVHQHAVDGLQVDGAVFANGSVRASAGFYPHDAVSGQGAAYGEQALVFLGVDVVGDGDQVVLPAHGFAQHFQQRGFSGAHRATNAHTQRWQVFGAVGDVVKGLGHESGLL